MIEWISIDKKKPRQSKRVLASVNKLVFTGTYINNDIVLADNFSDRGLPRYEEDYTGKSRAMKVTSWSELPDGPIVD